MHETENYLTVREICDALKISRQRVHQLLNKYKITPIARENQNPHSAGYYKPQDIYATILGGKRETQKTLM